MIRRYLAPLILASSLAIGCYEVPLQKNSQNIPRIEKKEKRKKETAKIYWKAYADEEYQKPTKACPKWKPCLEDFMNKAENALKPQIMSSKRFRRYYKDLDFIPSIGTWKSKDTLDEAKKLLKEFVKQKQYSPYDINIAFTAQLLDIDIFDKIGENPGANLGYVGYANGIPSQYAIIKKYKDNLFSTTIHEIGHMFYLFHHDTNGDMMHQNSATKNSVFSTKARMLMAEQVHSLIVYGFLKNRITTNIQKFKVIKKEIGTKFKEEMEIKKDAAKQCAIDQTTEDYQEKRVILNPSGSLTLEYHILGWGTKKEVKKIKNFSKYLKNLGIKEDQEEFISYKAVNGSGTRTHMVINIESNHFEKHFNPIITYLQKNSFIKPQKVKALKEFNNQSKKHNLKLYDILHYYYER